MSAGRKVKAVAIPPAAVANFGDQQYQVARDAKGKQDREDLLELVELAGHIGAHHAFSLVKHFTAAGEVKLFKRIRESNRIKDLPVRLPDGSVKSFDSIKDLCPAVFRRTYQSMLDAEQRYDALGEEAYEIGVQLRLNDSAVRAIGALPPDRRDIVVHAIAAGGTKAEVMEVIEELAIKVVKVEAERDEAKAEKEAGDHLLEKKNKRIDALERKLRHFDKAPPDEQLAELQKAATSVATEATGLIAGTLRQAVIALQHFGEERGEQSPFLAGLLGQVQAALSGLRQEFNLPDISQAESELQAGAREAIRAARQARGER